MSEEVPFVINNKNYYRKLDAILGFQKNYRIFVIGVSVFSFRASETTVHMKNLHIIKSFVWNVHYKSRSSKACTTSTNFSKRLLKLPKSEINIKNYR